MTTEIRCPQCSESFPAHVVEQFGGMCPACVAGFAELPTPSPDNTLNSGAIFGRYEIVRVLGRGGMGVVYLARQTGLDRLVALKVLSPRLAADQEFVNRFSHEAKALARLSHPNIVAVHDSGVEAGIPFLAMEYVEGENLRALLQKRRLEPEKALAIVPQLCNALEYAHAQGIIHRDIKPENILLAQTGGVKIADFGLAMLVGAGAPRLTQTNAIMGTPHYMAPEQVENPKAVDHRADIYSMGVVFYEMLTGELPIGAFSKPSEKAKVSRQLDDIVLRALAKEPLRRYQHAKDLQTDLSRAPVAPSTSGVVKGYEWKSQAAVFGWPLVHLCFGQDAQGRMVWAKGIIAIGNRAMGAIAIGGAAIGLLALGGGAIGLLAFGGGALGLLMAWGGGAIGGVAVGGGALGGVAYGGGAYGYYAMGGAAGGRYVVSPDRHDKEAERFFSRWVSLGPDFYQEGMRALKERDSKKALSLLEQVSLDHPNYPDAISAIAYDIFTLERNQPDAGLKMISIARFSHPRNAKIEFANRMILDEIGRRDGPEARRRAAERSPEFVPDPKEHSADPKVVATQAFVEMFTKDVLRKIEDPLRTASTAKISVEVVDTVDPGEKELAANSFQAKMFLKEGNRARIERDWQVNGKARHSTSVCDGTSYQVTRGKLNAVSNVRDPIVDLFTWGGSYYLGATSRFISFDEKGNCEIPKEVFKLSNLKLGPDDGASKTLTYTLDEGKQRVGEIQLWYDPKTYQIQKRTVKKPNSSGGGTLTETVTEYVLDSDIPDDTFKLAPQK